MSLSKRIGAGLSVAHVVIFIVFVIYLNFSTDGQSRLLWVLWLPLDFPVSLIVTWGFELVSSEQPIGGFIRMWLPYFVHGVLGAIWWFFVPTIIAGLFNKLFGSGNSKNSGAV